MGFFFTLLIQLTIFIVSQNFILNPTLLVEYTREKGILKLWKVQWIKG